MDLKEAKQELEKRISRREGLQDKLLRKRKTTKAFYRDLGELEGAIAAYQNSLSLLVDLQKTWKELLNLQELIDLLAQNPIDVVAIKAWQIRFTEKVEKLLEPQP